MLLAYIADADIIITVGNIYIYQTQKINQDDGVHKHEPARTGV